MSIIVSNSQHCNEQQFRTLSCVHYTIFSVVKSDLFIRALLLDRILVTEKNYAYASHTSCTVIDHFIVSSNIYDSITANNVLCDPTNVSLHNAISLSMSSFECHL